MSAGRDGRTRRRLHRHLICIVPLCALMCELAFAEMTAGELRAKAEVWLGSQRSADHQVAKADAGVAFSSYVSGVHDALLDAGVLCLAVDVPIDSPGILRMVKTYLDEHPKRMGEPASPVVRDALAQVFPECDFK